MKPSFLLDEDDDEEIVNGSNELVTVYPLDISLGLGPQLLRLKLCFSHHIKNLCNIMELTEVLVINTQVATSFSDVTRVCILFLTLPVSTATAERSFSKLKIIKNYLRSNMSQNRLSLLATISIERTRAHTINLDDVIL